MSIKIKKMKIKLFVFLLASLSMTQLAGQDLIFKGGLNFTNVSSEKDIDLSTSNGFHAGVGFEFPLISPVNLAAGLYYTRRGYKSNEVGKLGNVSIDYLDLPVDVMLKFGLGDLVGAYVSAGPYFSYGISSKVFDLNGVLQNGYDRDDIDLNRIDSGINIGAGVDVSSFRLSVAYGISLTDNGSVADNQLKNRVVRISLGYMIF